GKAQFERTVADDLVEDTFFRHQITLILDHKGASLAQLDGVLNPRIALVLNGKSVDLLLESLNQCSGGGQLGEVAQGVKVIKVNPLAEQAIADKLLHFGIEHIVAAYQSQVFHDGLGKIAHNAPVIGNAGRIQYGDVIDLAGGDVLENNLPLFFFAEFPVLNLCMAECSRVQRRHIFVFPVNTGAEDRQLDIQLVEVFGGALVVYFYNQRRYRLGPLAHLLPFEGNTLALD